MKKILGTLFFVFAIVYSSFSQNLTLSQLLHIRSLGPSSADDYLRARGWQFLHAYDWHDNNWNGIFYGYRVIDGKAESYLNFIYNHDYTLNHIFIQIWKTNVIDSYIRQIKDWGGSLINSYVEGESFVKVYQGSTMTYILTTSSFDDNDGSSKITDYHLAIYTNADYDQQ